MASVKEMKMQFRVKFELSLEWFEPRLRWRDLQNNSNLNIIPLNNLPEVGTFIAVLYVYYLGLAPWVVVTL